MTLPRVRSVDREPIVYNDNESTRVQTFDDDTSIFPGEPASRYLRLCAGKAGVTKRSWGCLGIIPSNRCCTFSMISQIWKKFAFNRAQDVVRIPLVYSAHCGACWSQGSHSNSAREISWNILFTSFVYGTNVYWSAFHGIKRKPHLPVVWNWYHFVAIAILHQPRPTESADINTRLQLSDTSSITPMHGGFLSYYYRLYSQQTGTLHTCI